MVMKKNGAVISVIALLLCVAVYLNWSYNNGLGEDIAVYDGDNYLQTSMDAGEAVETGSDADRFAEYEWEMTSSDDAESLDETYSVMNARAAEFAGYFDETRLSRQTTRDNSIAMLKETIANADASDTAKADAENKIALIASNAVKEARIESLVIAKGYLDCIAMVDDNGVSVVLLPEEEGLQSTDVARVKDIIIAEAAVKADMIKIIEAS